MPKLHFITAAMRGPHDFEQREPIMGETFADAQAHAKRYGTKIIGIKVGRCRAIVEAGEQRDRERNARHAGEAGIAIPHVQKSDLK